jgi:arsenite methyltransferase
MPDHAQDRDDVREVVRERYAAAARAVTAGLDRARCGCGPSDSRCCGSAAAAEAGAAAPAFGSALYGGAESGLAPDAAVNASLGCGVPTAVADLREGEVVLDLGSGAGADVLISARRVGPSGKAIGLDMTDEMLALARDNAERAGVANAEFLKGYIESLPLADA